MPCSAVSDLSTICLCPTKRMPGIYGLIMSAHVFLNLLKELRKRDKMGGFAEHFNTILQSV